MDDNSQIQQPNQKKSPTDLLQEQTILLSALVEIQKQQRDQIIDLDRKNIKIIQLIANLEKDFLDTEVNHVKIEDVNMPFGALVGLMLKISFAAIPAGIVLGAIYFLIISIITRLALG